MSENDYFALAQKYAAFLFLYANFKLLFFKDYRGGGCWVLVSQIAWLIRSKSEIVFSNIPILD